MWKAERGLCLPSGSCPPWSSSLPGAVPSPLEGSSFSGGGWIAREDIRTTVTADKIAAFLIQLIIKS